MRLVTIVMVAGTLAGTASTALADSLVRTSPGATALAVEQEAPSSADRYMTWFVQSEGRWKLIARSPDGTVTTPAIATFATPRRPSIDRGRAIYARDDGDLYALDLRSGLERRLRLISSRRYRERAVVSARGAYAFVRSNGPRPGLYAHTKRGGTRRIATDTPEELSIAGSTWRVAYGRGNAVVVWSLSGAKSCIIATSAEPASISLASYRAVWLEPGGRLMRTDRVTLGPRQPSCGAARTGSRVLPETTSSIGLVGTPPRWYLDAEGVKRIDPPVLFPAAATGSPAP